MNRPGAGGPLAGGGGGEEGAAGPGCPSNDTDAAAHIDAIFRLALEFGVDADFHTDFAGEPQHLHVRQIVERTLRDGWRGRVAVGHLTELAALPLPEQDDIIRGIAEAGIGVISLPATDLYLTGRRDPVNPRRGLTPIRRLLAAGVPIVLATNNVRNLFATVGTADLAHMAILAAVAAHMGTPEQLCRLVEAITVHPARILRLPDYGLEPGCAAHVSGDRSTRSHANTLRRARHQARQPGRASGPADGRLSGPRATIRGGPRLTAGRSRV